MPMGRPGWTVAHRRHPGTKRTHAGVAVLPKPLVGNSYFSKLLRHTLPTRAPLLQPSAPQATSNHADACAEDTEPGAVCEMCNSALFRGWPKATA
jgi:hypothetical protein